MPRMISTTIYVSPEQQEKLHKLQQLTKVPSAVRIRQGIDLVLGNFAQLLDEVDPNQEGPRCG